MAFSTRGYQKYISIILFILRRHVKSFSEVTPQDPYDIGVHASTSVVFGSYLNVELFSFKRGKMEMSY